MKNSRRKHHAPMSSAESEGEKGIPNLNLKNVSMMKFSHVPVSVTL